MAGKYYITTAIDYVNSAPHIGTAYEKISADVFARFHRLLGDNVYFQMGNDEHSLNVARAAREKGMDPHAYCDEMESVFRDIWAKLEISFDQFVRTTSEEHARRLSLLFRALADDVFKGHYEGYYCESCEAFLQEKDLVDGQCPTHGTEPTWIREENYFFRLSKYAEPLLEHIESHPEFIQPESRRNEILQLIKGGLDDISVTRAGSEWGVPLPMDPSHVIYVWVDALTNYITGVGYGEDDVAFEHWWPADVHLIGKDITRFHCVIWPAMLMSAGIKLPKTIYGHGFVYFKGQKLSKSRGVVVNPLEAADVFGPCALRYFLMREGTYGKDLDFTWEQFHSRYNSELANDLGNLVSRSTAMVEKFLGGRVVSHADATANDDGGRALIELAKAVASDAAKAVTGYAPQIALGRVWELVRRANAYIEEEKPWVLAKTDLPRLEQVLFDVLEVVRQIAIMTWSFMPAKSEEMLARIGQSFEPGVLPYDELMTWGHGWEGAASVTKGEPVFPKYSDDDLMDKFDVLSVGQPPGAEDAPVANAGGGDSVTDGGTAPPEDTPRKDGKAMISFDQFQALEFKLAVVLEAEKIEGAKKLLKLRVDLGGGDVRQMVAGISMSYAPDELVGKTILVLANLEPATIRGVESQAMLLAATTDDGIAVLVPDRALPAGTKVS
ncbi:methionine--tRNA ligase [bacterium]|nr:methionine--tRNA ligase [bacterium]